MAFKENGPVLFLAALRAEHFALARGLGYSGPPARCGELLAVSSAGKDFLSLHTGMGLDPTRRVLNAILTDHSFRAILHTGYCGALTDSLHTADVVLYEDCLAVDPERSADGDAPGFLPDERLFSRFRARLDAWEGGAHLGRGLTVPRIVGRREEKVRLAQQWQAISVDMESAAVLECAARHRIPCAVARIVLDTCEQDLPDFSGWTTTEGSLNLSLPGMIQAVSRFQPAAFQRWRQSERMARQALESLGRLWRTWSDAG